MEYIYDINSGLKHSIFSKQGIQLLKQYVRVFQNGGSNKDEDGAGKDTDPLNTKRNINTVRSIMNIYTQDNNNNNNKKNNDNLLRTLYPYNIIEQNPSPPSMSMSNTQDIDSVAVQIENAMSGKILGLEREIFKKDSSIQQIKTQVKEVIMNYINHPIYKLEFFKDLPDKRIKLNDKQILDELSYSDPIYKVFYKVGSHLMNLLDSYKTEDLEWDWNYLSR